MSEIESKKTKRARELKWIAGSLLDPGPLNAITDVPGVSVGHTTIILGEAGPLEVGRGPIRTGVTAICPHPGDTFSDKVEAGVHVLNGFGKTVGLEQVRELGILETPILLTNTLNVWRCADALVDWVLRDHPEISSINPVVGECNDGWLNDIQGRHVKRDHVFSVMQSSKGGPTTEGNVGAGTGTTCYQFKGGIGTSSRVLPPANNSYNTGVLVQSNFGTRYQLTIKGHPVGQLLQGWPQDDKENNKDEGDTGGGSCMVVIATDAPLSSRQLVRLARRAPLGLARTGFISNPTSGDYVIAFSTVVRRKMDATQITDSTLQLIDEIDTMGLLFQAVVEATEEAVLNSLIAATTIEGRDHHIAHAIPIDIIQQIFS